MMMTQISTLVIGQLVLHGVSGTWFWDHWKWLERRRWRKMEREMNQ